MADVFGIQSYNKTGACNKLVANSNISFKFNIRCDLKADFSEYRVTNF